MEAIQKVQDESVQKKIHLFTIYDKVAQDHGAIFDAVNDSVAERYFTSILMNTSVPVRDFELVSIGSLTFSHEVAPSGKKSWLLHFEEDFASINTESVYAKVESFKSKETKDVK